MKSFLVIVCLIFSSLSASAKSLVFAQVTDIHFSSDVGNAQGRDVSMAGEHLNKIINALNENDKIDFVVFSGDAINESKESNLRAFLAEVSRLAKPYYILLGNHDAHMVAGMSKKRFFEIVSESNPYQLDAQANYTVELKDRFVLLVADASAARFPSSHGYFSETTLAWFNKTLSKNKHKEVLVFQHFPIIPPLENPSHEVLNPSDYQNILDKHRNVLMVASGHFHGGNQSLLKNGVYHVATPSSLNDDCPYRIFKVDYEKPAFRQPKINNFETLVQSL